MLGFSGSVSKDNFNFVMICDRLIIGFSIFIFLFRTVCTFMIIHTTKITFYSSNVSMIMT